jgi:hypothetical protein
MNKPEGFQMLSLSVIDMRHNQIFLKPKSETEHLPFLFPPPLSLMPWSPFRLSAQSISGDSFFIIDNRAMCHVKQFDVLN